MSSGGHGEASNSSVTEQGRAGQGWDQMGRGSPLDTSPSSLLPLTYHGMNHGSIDLSALKDHGSLQELEIPVGHPNSKL